MVIVRTRAGYCKSRPAGRINEDVYIVCIEPFLPADMTCSHFCFESEAA